MLWFIIGLAAAFVFGLAAGTAIPTYQWFVTRFGRELFLDWFDKIAGKTGEELLTSTNIEVREYGKFYLARRRQLENNGVPSEEVDEDLVSNVQEKIKDIFRLTSHHLLEEEGKANFWLRVWTIIISGLLILVCVLCYTSSKSDEKHLEANLVPVRRYKPSTEYYTEWVPRETIKDQK